MKKLLGALPVLVLLLTLCPAWGVELPVQAEAALLMEKETGQVLYAKNEHQALEPASVTKVMTLLLVMEAIDRGTLAYDDVVTVSDYAASMGGSQIFLSPGEQITVEDLLKGVCVSSGNDAAVALAEKTAGVTELFVEQMNNRARELGMQDTHFVNCTGLPAEGHVTSAWDIAVMSRELIRRHPDIRRFTTIWMDTLRDGQFQLSNTNKLIRFYDGAENRVHGLRQILHFRHGGAGGHGADRRGAEIPHRPAAVRGRQDFAELWVLHLWPGPCRPGGAAAAGAGDLGDPGCGAAHGGPGGGPAAGGKGPAPGTGADGDSAGVGGGSGASGGRSGDPDRHPERRNAAGGTHPGGGNRGKAHLRGDVPAPGPDHVLLRVILGGS